MLIQTTLQLQKQTDGQFCPSVQCLSPVFSIKAALFPYCLCIIYVYSRFSLCWVMIFFAFVILFSSVIFWRPFHPNDFNLNNHIGFSVLPQEHLLKQRNLHPHGYNNKHATETFQKSSAPQPIPRVSEKSTTQSQISCLRFVDATGSDSAAPAGSIEQSCIAHKRMVKDL